MWINKCKSPSKFEVAVCIDLANRMYFFWQETLKSSVWFHVFYFSCYSNLENKSRWSLCQPRSLTKMSRAPLLIFISLGTHLINVPVIQFCFCLFLQYNLASYDWYIIIWNNIVYVYKWYACIFETTEKVTH